MFSLNSIKAKLEKEKKAIETEIKSLAMPPEFGDEIDRGAEETDEAEEFGTHLGIQQVLRNKLEGINETLQKIEMGKYGICESCGKKISWIILRIYPASRLCQKCKKLVKK
ncbi:MAG: hypothetical protein Q8N22_02140 [bacterium]|nr:hypothetical protein [bacterium]